MAVDFTPTRGDYLPLRPFRFWCQKVLPLVYDDSLSYYELLNKVVDYLNKTMEDVETLETDVSGMYNAYNQLQNYVNSYFDNLDVQKEINNKLDAMAKDGSLSALIQPLFDEYKSAIDAEVAQMHIDIDAEFAQMNSDIDVLEERMSAFASLPDGSTAGDAELLDIRIGYNGVTYPSAGDAVRGQANSLKSDLGTEIGEITAGKGTLVEGEYVKYDTGEFLPFGGWSRTGYLTCERYTKIKVNITTLYSAFYDSNNQYISQANFQTDTFLSVPQNARYYAISGLTSDMQRLVIMAEIKGMGHILNEKIENVEDFTITEKTETAPSLIDGYMIIADGRQLQTPDWVCTDYIDMPFDEKFGYDIHGTFYGIGGCAIYDKNNNVLLGIDENNVATYGGSAIRELQTIHVDGVAGAKKIRISGLKTTTTSASDLWIKGNTFNDVYEHLFDVEKDITEIKGTISTTIATSKVLVIGDSISSDAYANYPKWVTALKNQGFLPDDTTNSSQHATGFVARYNNLPNDFITRLKAIENPSQYDLVVIFGGINDYIQNIPMGEETGTDYTVSFKPAVNEFFNYLIQNFTQARICVLLPLRTYATWQNSVGEYQQAYGDYIKQVAKSYCLPILNLTEDSGFCPYIATFSDMWTLLPAGFQSHDGVHPNEEYERRFLAPMIKHFLQGLL